jgi:HD-GYP domain-containing protein (c-di-GMP phosphodiesterase class II)
MMDEKGEAARELWTYLNEDLEVIGKRVHDRVEYTASSRPWFLLARENLQEGVLTDTYLFDSFQEPGITAAKSIGTQCVVGIDITLASLEDFLNNLYVSENCRTALLDAKGSILASNSKLKEWIGSSNDFLAPINTTFNDNTDMQGLSEVVLSPTREGAFSMRDTYMIWSRSWEPIGGHVFDLIMIAPSEDFLGYLVEMRQRAIASALFLLFLLFPFVMLGSRRLSHFLTILAREARRMKNLDFNGDVPQKTIIVEFAELSEAFALMKSALKAKTKDLQIATVKLQRIIDLGIAMSVEKNTDLLTEMILKGAKEIGDADGGSLYLKKGDHLEFQVVLNDSLNIAQGGAEKERVRLPHVPLYKENGEPNRNNVVSCAIHDQRTIVVDNAYESKGYDFTGTREFDTFNNYKSISFMTVPLQVQGGDMIGALQLINARSPVEGQIIPFSDSVKTFIEALSAEAAAIYQAKALINSNDRLLESFIQLIAGAIDTKSPYTGGHCKRVPELAIMLANEAERTSAGPLADFRFSSDEERKAFRYGAWLHDCGKITTPEYVVDKSVKLETINNRIHEIRMRFEIFLRDLKIEELEAVMSGKNPADARTAREEEEDKLFDDFSFIAECNYGNRYLSDGDIKRLRLIGNRKWFRRMDPSLGLSWAEHERFVESGRTTKPGWEFLLDDRKDHIILLQTQSRNDYKGLGFMLEQPEYLYNNGELYNLSIPVGTLNREERYKINEHIIQTIMMLQTLPFPDALKRVPEFAGTHHERLSGDGYPRMLKADDLSIPSRIMAIADIFEALTAGDRPYKRAKKISEAIEILYQFKKDNHIDPDLFNLFLTSGIFSVYAKQHLPPDLIDEVDVDRYLE